MTTGHWNLTKAHDLIVSVLAQPDRTADECVAVIAELEATRLAVDKIHQRKQSGNRSALDITIDRSNL